MILALTSDDHDAGPDLRRRLDHPGAAAVAGRRRRRGRRSAAARCRRCGSSSTRPRCSNYGIGLEDVRAALAAANANRPKGVGRGRRAPLADLRQRPGHDRRPTTAPLVVAYRNGAAVRLARRRRRRSTRCEDVRNVGLSNGKPAVLLIICRQPGANIIETVDRVQGAAAAAAGLDPGRHRPAGRDRTAPPTIRASLHDVERTLLIAIAAGDPGGVRCSCATCARHADPGGRGAGLADRHLRRHVPAAASASTTCR